MGAGLGLAIMQVLAAEVLMSGSFSAVFLEPSYRLEVEERVRIRYASEEDAEGEYREKLADAQRRLLQSLSGSARFLATAATRGVSVVPFRPGLPPIPIRSAEALGALDPASFPVTVSLVAAESPEATETVALTLGAPVPKAQRAWLLQQVKAMALAPAAQKDVAEPGAHFVVDPASSRLGGFFGLSVATLGLVRREALPDLQGRLDRCLEPVFALLAARLPDAAAVTKHTGLSQPLPAGGRLDAGVESLHALFNHHGPLYDSLARERVEQGFVQAVVLFAPAKADPSVERPPSGFLDWLRQAFVGALEPHAAAAATELSFHRLQFGEESERYGALDTLKGARSARLEALIERILHEKSDSPSLRLAAAEALARWDGPGVRRIFTEIATRRRPRDVLSIAAPALARFPEPDVARALLGVWADHSLEWNDRYPARDALNELLPKLKGPPALLEELRRGLAAD